MHGKEGDSEISRVSLRTPQNFFERVVFSLQHDRDHYPLARPTRLLTEEATNEEKTLTGIVLPNEPESGTFVRWIPDSFSDESYLTTLGYSILRNNRTHLYRELGLEGVDIAKFPELVKILLGLSDDETAIFLGGKPGNLKNESQSRHETAFLTARFLVDALVPVHGDNFGEVIRTESDSYHHKSILGESATNSRFVVGRVYEDMNWGRNA